MTPACTGFFSPAVFSFQNCKNFFILDMRLATRVFRQSQSWLQRCLYLTRNMVRLRKSRSRAVANPFFCP